VIKQAAEHFCVGEQVFGLAPLLSDALIRSDAGRYLRSCYQKQVSGPATPYGSGLFV
jgi:hypothetical protein